MAKRSSVKDVDKGFKRLAAELNGLGSVTLGVQGAEASKRHPDAKMTIGELAVVHELGIGVPQRSWLLKWMSENAQQMEKDTAHAYKRVADGTVSRKDALAKLGYMWTDALRRNVADGRITPPLSATTIALKGHSTPLLDSATLVNSITYKVFLPQFKSVKDTQARVIARRGKTK